VLVLPESNRRAESLISFLAGRGGNLNEFRLKPETLNGVLTCEPVVLIEVGSDWIVE
jgi:hypothetical protein